MKCKIIAILLSGCLLYGLCSCGGGSSASPSEGGKSSNSSVSTSTTAETESKNKNYTRMQSSYGANGELYYRREYIYHNGEVESVTSYSADGNESGHVDLVYDEHGNCLVDYRIQGLGRRNGLPNPTLDSGKVSPTEYEFEYDSAGNIATKTRLYDNGVREIDEYSYDSAGQIISIKNHFETKDAQTGYVQPGYGYKETSNEYDANGRLETSIEQSTSYDLADLSDIANATPLYTETKETSYEYDSYDKLIAARGQKTIRSRELSPQETVTVSSYATLYEYDDEGREVVRDYREYGSSGEETLVSRTEQEWDDGGKLLKSSKFDQNGLTEYTIYYYNVDGKMSARTDYSREDYIVANDQEILFERIEYTYTDN